MNKKSIFVFALVGGLIYSEIKKIQILMNHEEEIQSIFSRERKFADDITKNNFAIDILEEDVKKLYKYKKNKYKMKDGNIVKK